jgi:hypothetical protein
MYLGTEPLDPTLADRFGFLAEVPDWSDLSEAERTAPSGYAMHLVDSFF